MGSLSPALQIFHYTSFFRNVVSYRDVPIPRDPPNTQRQCVLEVVMTHLISNAQVMRVSWPYILTTLINKKHNKEYLLLTLNNKSNSRSDVCELLASLTSYLSLSIQSTPSLLLTYCTHSLWLCRSPGKLSKRHREENMSTDSIAEGYTPREKSLSTNSISPSKLSHSMLVLSAFEYPFLCSLHVQRITRASPGARLPLAEQLRNARPSLLSSDPLVLSLPLIVSLWREQN